jgi:hypothetical protein
MRPVNTTWPTAGLRFRNHSANASSCTRWSCVVHPKGNESDTAASECCKIACVNVSDTLIARSLAVRARPRAQDVGFRRC